MMNKKTLFTIFQKQDYADSYVWDCWFDWRCKQENVDSRNNRERWTEMLNEMPKYYHWRPTPTGKMLFDWEGGTETVPLAEFIPEEQVANTLTMLWHCGFYDSPLSGMARYNGRAVWFDLKKDTKYGDRIYNVYELSDDEIKAKYERHDRFCKFVGHHCDHLPEQHSWKLQDRDTMDQFYDWANENPEEFNMVDRKPLLSVHWYEFEYWYRPTREL